MRLLKKIFAFMLALVLVFQSSMDVFAAKRKSGKRAATTGKKSSKSGKRAASKGKKGGRSGKRAAATRKSGKRAAATSKSGKRAAASRIRSGKRAAARGVSSGNAYASGLSANVTSDSLNAPKACVSAYVQCMDTQIPGFISKFSYLNNDATVEAMLETGEPLRCLYYYDLDNSRSERSSSVNLAEDDDAIVKDMNYLYFAYNYYCKPITGTVNGRPVNMCGNANATVGNAISSTRTEFVLDENGEKIVDADDPTGFKTKTVAVSTKSAARKSSDVFATQNSTAYYKEAFDKMENDELNIINFEKTQLYKNKFANLENVSSKMLTNDDVGDLLASLGISTSSKNEDGSESFELFSLSVTPPIGAGTAVAQDLYRKAHNICMGLSELPTPKASGLSQKVISEELRRSVGSLKSAICQGYEEMYKNYYLFGKECPSGSVYNSSSKKCEVGMSSSDCPSGSTFDSSTGRCQAPAEDDNSCANGFTYNSARERCEKEVDVVDADFLTAQKSCDTFEQGLMSSRDSMYGKFESEMKGYLEDHVAKLLKKKVKNIRTTTAAISSMESLDNEIADADLEQAAKANELAEKRIKLQTEQALKMAEAKKQLIGTFKDKLITQCDNQAQNLDKDDYANLFASIKDMGVCVSSKNKFSEAQFDTDNPGNTKCKNSADTLLLCVEDIGINVDTMVANLTNGTDWSTQPTVTVETSGILTPGVYMVELGGHGFPGIKAATCGLGGHWGGGDLSDGQGQKQRKEFVVDKNTKYTASWKEGSKATFTLNGKFTLTAEPGTAPRAGSWHLFCDKRGHRDGVDNVTSWGSNPGKTYVTLWKKK